MSKGKQGPESAERRSGHERRRWERRRQTIPVHVDRRGGKDRREGGDRRQPPT